MKEGQKHFHRKTLLYNLTRKTHHVQETTRTKSWIFNNFQMGLHNLPPLLSCLFNHKQSTRDQSFSENSCISQTAFLRRVYQAKVTNLEPGCQSTAVKSNSSESQSQKQWDIPQMGLGVLSGQGVTALAICFHPWLFGDLQGRNIVKSLYLKYTANQQMVPAENKPFCVGTCMCDPVSPASIQDVFTV